MITKSSIEFY